MTVNEEVTAAFQKLLLPELSLLKQEFAKINMPSSLPSSDFNYLNARVMNERQRIDRLYEVVAFRDELKQIRADYQRLITRISLLEQEIAELKKKAGS